jgi:malonate decarboxylase epsilon subunit
LFFHDGGAATNFATALVSLLRKHKRHRAIVGLNESQVTKIVQAVTSVQNPVFVGNINAPRQIVIAGSNVGMDRALEEARRQGARKAVFLHVSVPSHCPLLQPVADLLGKRMSSVNLTSPRMTYVGNVNARAMRTKETVARDLVNNIAHGVRWHDATTVLEELGCKVFLEMPPGHALSDLAEENLPGIKSVPVEASVLPKVLRRIRPLIAHDSPSPTLSEKWREG